MQHFTSGGSLGQKPEREVPPEPLHLAVGTQTPGVPSTEQGPSTAASVRLDMARMAQKMSRRCDIVSCVQEYKKLGEN